MRKIKCPVCQEEHETFMGDYLYTESGLDNVMLCKIEIFRCACGESPVIPSPLALHDFIAHCLLNQKESLSAKEIKFLRKRMKLTGKDLAQSLGVDNATVSRWEHGKDKPSELADRLIRLVYAAHMGLATEVQTLVKTILPFITSSGEKMPINVMADQLGRFSCTQTCT